jgi:acyl carrier protein
MMHAAYPADLADDNNSLTTMGLDLLDLTFRIEKDFHIDVPRDEFHALLQDGDIVVADLYEFILRRLHLRDTGRNSVRLNAFLWSEMRAALHSATNTPFDQIELGTPLEKLFPREIRRSQWEALRDVCPYKIRDLDYSGFVRLAGFLLAVGVVVIEQGNFWQIPGAQWFWPLLGAVGIWMVGETYAKLLRVFAPLRRCFPSGMRTVKDLCRAVMSMNYADICKESDFVLDERCSVVWEQLVEILAGVLGVDPGQVTFRSRLIADLGAS